MLARLIAAFCLLVPLAAAPQPAAAQDTLTVFAAASMRNALDDVDKAFTKASGVKVFPPFLDPVFFSTRARWSFRRTPRR